MKTVDALIAARDLFASDPTNWTRGGLRKRIGGKNCYCALGGISLVTGCISADGERAENVAVSCTEGPKGVTSNEGWSLMEIGELSQSVLLKFAAKNVHLLAAKGAIEYLSAACEQLFGEKSIIHVNDVGPNKGALTPSNAEVGYATIMKAFDRAIRNAKRRHITGDRKKAAVQAVAQ